MSLLLRCNIQLRMASYSSARLASQQMGLENRTIFVNFHRREIRRMHFFPAVFRTALLAGSVFLSLGAAAASSDEMKGAYIDFGRTPSGPNNTHPLTAGLVVPALM